MATVEEVVQELIKRTESGELEWQNDYVSTCWNTTTDKPHVCTFTVFLPPQLTLTVMWGQPLHSQRFDGDSIKPLASLLLTKYPFQQASEDKALQIALECLKAQ